MQLPDIKILKPQQNNTKKPSTYSKLTETDSLNTCLRAQCKQYEDEIKNLKESHSLLLMKERLNSSIPNNIPQNTQQYNNSQGPQISSHMYDSIFSIKEDILNMKHEIKELKQNPLNPKELNNKVDFKRTNQGFSRFWGGPSGRLF